ncbi:ribonucleoside hydrolase RihC [Periweissella ghanensis]|uniref:Non-specific ribonucleoside hydrolase RihC n=1 Tax=Periweissella ghanensis TaxID=467997 RepID=A0ABM8ZD78_9LACO|nr:ribonucleoside hydrolase RihC [Periweissella ghanensis]MCM0601365.1 ribonucleoside hydrolase RihC [Periweissella ghanensis]CAH0419419.1 Non-specific ribonucleoside hydrolase RihC [Periweissella ghanensis]
MEDQIKVIIDCDPGIDDAAALAIVLTNPKFDVRLITTVAGNVTVDKTTINALKLVHFFDADVPVAAGAVAPLIKPFEDAARIHGESGMPGYDFGELYGTPIAKDAVTAMYEVLMASAEPITLIPTGAYTNIALLLRLHPEVAPKIKRIVAMGGSISGGNMTSTAEFNVFTDPHAAEIMYNAGIPVTMIGLDITLKALLTPDTIAKLPELNEAGKMLRALITHYNDGGAEGVPMHDVNTIFYLLHPEAIETHAYWIDVVLEGPAIGTTVADIRGAYHDGKTNVDVAVGIDAAAFNEFMLTEVSGMDKI